MRRSRLQSLLDALPAKVNHLIDKAAEYHQRFTETPTFRGPSLHFHHRALEPRPLDQRVEAIYAVLTSWGMHRMGAGGPKMREFAEFRKAVLGIQEGVKALASVSYETASGDQIDRLVRLARGFRVMRTGTWLVANSKVLAHLLPNLVAPIDREYTLAYLLGGNGQNLAPDNEEALFRIITTEFYWPIARDQRFRALACQWLSEDPSSWDTSALKIVDNLVIQARTEQRAAEKRP